ncbi:type II secretion system protein [Pseudoxanthomonas broegbernensis]|nr:prepilin-type N-terminal cleavage/methylation domain-containing protein [Pseudoxanthomonas broegbernensis]MBB6065732.1 prepilin-type N-terminal cleavage/methylation domain-containing protein [Pseudoxanthomonas broegbernensis]
MHSPKTRRRCGGFTILEMSVVLVVIALIIGAVSVGRDVYRSAMAERIGSEFVQGWIIAYDRYVAQTGTVPGDDLANPTGRVNGNGDPLCDQGSTQRELRNAMLERGVSLPAGRAEGQESRFVYQDSRGIPQEIRVCFLTVTDWAEPSTGNAYTPRVRNVMRLEGLTPELANQLDARIDGRIDARFGRMREATPGSLQYRDVSAIGDPPQTYAWSRTEIQDASGGTNAPDDQSTRLVAYLKMNQ